MLFRNRGAVAKSLPAFIGAVVVLPAGLTLGLLYWQIQRLERVVGGALLDRQMESHLLGYYNLCKSHSDGEQETARNILRTKRIGESGYVSILQGKGEARGRYILSKDGKRDGESLWQDRSIDGKFFVQDIILKALAAGDGRVSQSEPYFWRNPGEKAPRKKFLYSIYYEPWDWVISVGVYDDDRDALIERVRKSFSHILISLLCDGSTLALLTLALGIAMSRSISRSLSQAIAAAQTVARGELDEAEAQILEACRSLDPGLAEACLDPAKAPGALRDNETARLVLALVGMVRNLKFLMGEIQASIVELLSKSTEIADKARQQETTLHDLGTSTNEIAASVNQISATSKELAETMARATTTAEETGALAGSGGAAMRAMAEEIAALSKDSERVSSKFRDINERAGNINAVVAAIGQVAEETNLLSLNAAVEAEKAGEHGLGFGVVSREIRRLADQTAGTALDVEGLIQEMQSSVTSGAMEMDRFGQVMLRSLEQVDAILSQLGEVASGIEELPPRLLLARDGMRSQSQGAHQINEAMIRLNSAVRGALESMRDFNRATENMQQAVKGLRDESRKFVVSGARG
jgi:methyl-accepting chemotaxis protein WspA